MAKTKAISIPNIANTNVGKQTTKVTFNKQGGPTSRKDNFSIVTVQKDTNGVLSLEIDKNQSTIGDPNTLTSEHMTT